MIRFMYNLKYAKKFKKSIKRYVSNVAFKKDVLRYVTDKLLAKEKLEEKFKVHELKGSMAGQMELHLAPDILLTYEYQDDVLVLLYLNIGSHTELFD